MDLNELLHRHQVSLMSADAAACAEARIVHHGLARLYEDRIRDVRPMVPENAPLTAGLRAA